MSKLHVQRTIELEVTPERIWPYVAQTDRLNREIGLPEPEFTFYPRALGGTEVMASAKLGVLQFRYEEHPFEWVKPDYFHVRRVFLAGPLRWVVAGTRIERTDGGCRITAYSDAECAAWSVPIMRAIFARSLSPLMRAFQRFGEVSRGEPGIVYPRISRQVHVREERLDRAIAELKRAGIAHGLAGALEQMIRNDPDPDVREFRARELAVRLQVRDEARILELCLAATKAGILDLEWRVLCPYCRSNRTVVSHLNEITAEAHCESCAIQFDSTFDENVEVVFSVAEAIREVSRSIFCIGGPQNSPFAVAQFVLPPRESRKVSVPGDVAGIRVVCLQVQGRPTMQISNSGVSICTPDLNHSDHYTLAPTSSVILENPTSETITVRFEDASQLPNITTAAELTCMQEFRGQFSSEVLSPGNEMAIRQVTILFTDLKGSTRMYRELGDAPSYAAVREHFSQLRKIISDEGGAVVKTIGDAVMAAFTTPEAAIRAALEIQRLDDGLITKIGLHAGPAILVNANGLLDYFGRTVNLASRLQKHSVGGDVVLSEETMCPLITDAEREFFEAEVPDFNGCMRLIRLRPIAVDAISGPQ